jgi:hypothetical protein
MRYLNKFKSWILFVLVFTFFKITAEAQIKVGVGKTDITPPLGTPMDGYYVERFATTVHDALYARAMVLKDGTNTLVLVVTDLIDVAPYGFPAARERIQKDLNVPAENIIISATHTHTGPTFSKEYEELLIQKIFDAVKIATANLQNAVIKAGTGKAEDISFHRRFMMKDGTVRFNPGRLNPDIVEPMGPVDPGVGIIYIEGIDGSPLAVLVNFALHLDTIGGTEISEDFPYFMGEVLKKVLGDDLMVFFGFGTCGNVNHINVQEPETTEGYERAERIGYALAAAVIRELPVLEVQFVGKLTSESETVYLKIPEYTEEEIEAARINAKKESDEIASTPEIREAMKILRIYNLNNEPIEAEIITFGFGDASIVALPGEIFVELGLAIKEKSPFKHTLVMTLSNNSIGYIPNEEAFKYGAYEVEVSMIAEGEGEKLVDSSINQLEKIKQ